MELNEIKKALYKQKPIASNIEVNDKNAVYITHINTTESNEKEIKFIVPLKETGDFDLEMPAQLLIRWLVKE